MSLEALREEVMQTVREADEPMLLRVKEVIDMSADDVEIPQEVLDEVHRRRDRYLRGEGRSYAVEEAHELIRRQYRERGEAL